MARDISIAEALAVLAQAEGITLTDEQKNLAAKVARDEMTGEAVNVLTAKGVSANVALKYAETLFSFAETFASKIHGENVGRGRGEVFEQVVRIETPSGTLKVSLTNEPRDSK